MHNVNWDDYRFLIAVMEEGSLNAAAKRLGVNHATVLRRVSAFEINTGVRLFERHKSGYRIGAARPNLVAALTGVRDAVEAAHRAVQGQGQEMRGSVKITSTDSLCETVLPAMIAGLHAKHPGLRLTLLATNTHLNLARMDAEISVRPTPALPEDVEGVKVCKMVFKVYGSAEYLTRNKVANGAHKWLTPSASIDHSAAGRWLARNIKPEQVVFQADSFLNLRSMAVAGMGLAFLPCCTVRPSDGLVTSPEFDVALETQIWVACHRDLDDLPRIRACKAFLVKELQAQADLLEGRRTH